MIAFILEIPWYVYPIAGVLLVAFFGRKQLARLLPGRKGRKP